MFQSSCSHLYVLIYNRFEGNLKVIKKRGTIVVFGTTSGPLPLFDLRRFMEKKIKFTYTT